MRILVCISDSSPCPGKDQQWISAADIIDPSILDFSSLGITSDLVLHVFSWGFAVVLLGFFIGYCLSLAIGLIRRL